MAHTKGRPDTPSEADTAHTKGRPETQQGDTDRKVVMACKERRQIQNFCLKHVASERSR